MAHTDGAIAPAGASPPPGDPGGSFRWGKLRAVAAHVYGSTTRHGRGAVLHCTPQWLLVGTEAAEVLVFAWGAGQRLRAVLAPPARAGVRHGPVAALAASADGRAVAAGYAGGFVAAWDVAAAVAAADKEAAASGPGGSGGAAAGDPQPAAPFLYVPPLAAPPDPQARFQDRETHVAGTPITHVFFNAPPNTDAGPGALVGSADARGLMFEHRVAQLLMRRHVASRRVSGSYTSEAGAAGAAAGAAAAAPLLACTTFHVGTARREPTIIAAVSPTVLTLHALWTPATAPEYPQGVLFRYPRGADNVSTATGLAAALAWSPTARLLAYAWGNHVGVLKVEWAGGRANKDGGAARGAARGAAAGAGGTGSGSSADAAAAPRLVCTLERALTAPHTVVWLAWLPPALLLVATVTLELLVVRLDTMAVLDTLSLRDKDPVHADFFGAVVHGGRYANAVDAFAPALQVHGAALFVLGRHELVYGAMANWADRVMALLNQSRPVEAIELALHYYEDPGDLTLIGLGDTTKHASLLRALPDIVLTSLRFALEHDPEITPALLRAALRAIFTMGLPLLEQVLELADGIAAERSFAHELVPYILGDADGAERSPEGTIALPPSVARAIVRVFASGPAAELQQLVLAIDPTVLDIDFAMNVARALKLPDLVTYLTSAALRDWVGALRAAAPPERKFAYLAAALTGRAFPDERPLPAEAAAEAKRQLWGALFFGPDDALLRALVAENAHVFFTVLDGAFEDSFLNDDYGADAYITRQAIVNILVGVVGGAADKASEASADRFPLATRAHLDVFIARNVPKYPQYLLVANGVLERVIAELCDVGREGEAAGIATPPPSRDATPALEAALAADAHAPPGRDACELALLSLLGAYKPEHTARVLALLREARFFVVLAQVHRAAGRWAPFLAAVLEAAAEPGADAAYVWAGIDAALAHDAAAAAPLVRGAFARLAALDARRLAGVATRARLRDLDGALAGVADADALEFLDVLFAAPDGATGGAADARLRSLAERYVRLLAATDGARLLAVLTHRLTRPGDVDLAAVEPALTAHARVDSLLLLLSRLGRPAEAMDRLVAGIAGAAARDAPATATLPALARLGVRVCSEATARDAAAAAALWQRLLVALAGAGAAPGAAAARDAALRVLVEAGLRHERLFASVVAGFWPGAAAAGAAAADEGGAAVVLSASTFAVLRAQHTALAAVRDIVAGEMHGDVLNLLAERLRGWSVALGGECEACGQKLVGVGIDATTVYSAWEAKLRAGPVAPLAKSLAPAEAHALGSEGAAATAAEPSLADPDGALVIFKCGHSYHLACLRRLTPRIECIVEE